MREINGSDFMSVADIAQEMGVTQRTVRYLFASGAIVGRKVGRKYIATRDDVKAYIHGKRA